MEEEFIELLEKLKKLLNLETIDLNVFSYLIRKIFNIYFKVNYVNYLTSPEDNKNLKIPTNCLTPSVTFQAYSTFTGTISAYGTFLMIFNPFFLFDGSTFGEAHPTPIEDTSGTEKKKIYLNQNISSLTFVTNFSGDSENEGNWFPQILNQEVQGLYDQYRLVSASVIIKYLGKLEEVQGVIGAAISYDNTHNIVGSMTVPFTSQTNIYFNQDKDLKKYTKLSLVNDCLIHKENNLYDGIRMIYFPLDNSYEEFISPLVQNDIKLDYKTRENWSQQTDGNYTLHVMNQNYKSGFNFISYVRGGTIGASIKVDVYCNFEGIVNSKKKNMFPIGIDTELLNEKDKKTMIRKANMNPIMTFTKFSGERREECKTKFEEIKKKIGNSIKIL